MYIIFKVNVRFCYLKIRYVAWILYIYTYTHMHIIIINNNNNNNNNNNKKGVELTNKSRPGYNGSRAKISISDETSNIL